MSKHNAHGTLLKLGSALVSPTYTTIAQVVSISGPNQTRGTTPVPTHDDTGGIDKIADALYDGGQVTFSVLFDPSLGTHDASTGVKALADSGAERPYQLIFPTAVGVQYEFNAFVVSHQPTGMDANTGVLRADVTLEITGGVTEV
jgi:hypothetical protein